MGQWKRCPKCGGKITVTPVLDSKGKTSQAREAWVCPTDGIVEVKRKHPVQIDSPQSTQS